MPGPQAFAGPERLRVYRPADYRAVRDLWARSGLRVGPTDTFDRLERTRRRDPGLFLVALAGREVVGAVFGCWDGYRGWVHHLAVDPSRQRHGIGRTLLAELERRLRARGCPKINLHVEPGNRGVVGFYARSGYQLRAMLFLEKWVDPAVRPPGASEPRRTRRRKDPRGSRGPTPRAGAAPRKGPAGRAPAGARARAPRRRPNPKAS